MKNQWVVVANASLARIFRRDGANGGLEPVEDMAHTQSRMHAKELAETAGPEPGVRDHHDDRFAARSDPRRKEHQIFARALADRLDKALANHEFDSLVLLAAKPFLGEIRHFLSEGVNDRVAVALNNDFTGLSAAEIAQRLELAGAAGHSSSRGAA
ncbi:host attachment protein [Variovorax ureilyticus]|uniref:Host attachment protein n=1 Tax=Variovorax ureilyticus TaxID=1836198 RepID=A0ABU8VB31_9BURK